MKDNENERCKGTIDMFKEEHTYLELQFRDSDIEKIKAAASELNMPLHEFITKRVTGEI
jgi:predicted DNA binding CopG/RHH family protein